MRFTPTFTPTYGYARNVGVASPVCPAIVDLFDGRPPKSKVLLHSARPPPKWCAQPLGLLASGLRVWRAQIPPLQKIAHGHMAGNENFALVEYCYQS